MEEDVAGVAGLQGGVLGRSQTRFLRVMALNASALLVHNTVTRKSKTHF